MSRPRRASAAALLAACLALALSLGTPTTSGTLVGRITNSTNTAASAIFTTCTLAARAVGTAFFVHPLSEAVGPVVTDVSGNNRPGTYRGTGITYGAPGPCPRDGGRAVTLDGSTGFATSTARVTVPATQAFTAAIWFRTSTGKGGKLLGFGNSADGQSSVYDRHLYMTDAGRVVAGVYPGEVKTLVSDASYNDNAWHHAVMTLGPTGNANQGLRLYVDGVRLKVDTTVVSAEGSTGNWHIGFDNLGGWTSAPSSYYFAGSLAYAETFSSTLTPDQVTSLYNAGR